MSEPIDIKTKKIIPQLNAIKFDKSLVLDNLEHNILTHWDTWGKFQQSWTNSAYRTFKDLEKYIVMIYLIRNHWQSLSDKFIYFSMDEFYDQNEIIIDKINLIQISNELNIPKETIRRKVNELQDANILTRNGKSITFNKSGIDFQKPQETNELLSNFIEKKSKMMEGNDWFGEGWKKEEIKKFIKKYFTIFWLRFLKLQIPFLIRHKNVFGDLESWIVWGNIALTHQYNLAKNMDNDLYKNKNGERIVFKNYYSSVINIKMKQGVNASSISDISTIPRATVIRKLKHLVKTGCISKTENLEYIMTSKGKMNKKIASNFLLNQNCVAEFLTDIFDLMKNSNFKL